MLKESNFHSMYLSHFSFALNNRKGSFCSRSSLQHSARCLGSRSKIIHALVWTDSKSFHPDGTPDIPQAHIRSYFHCFIQGLRILHLKVEKNVKGFLNSLSAPNPTICSFLTITSIIYLKFVRCSTFNRTTQM